MHLVRRDILSSFKGTNWYFLPRASCAKLLELFFPSTQKKRGGGVNIGMTECGKKSRNSSRQSLAEPAAFYCAKLKPLPATKLLRSIRNTSPSYTHELDSEGMTSLHTTGSSTSYILPVGRSHFYNASIDIAGNWIFLWEGRFATFVAKRLTVNSLFRAYAELKFYQRNLQSATINERCW
jgi:hypothetical protein